MIPRRRDCQVGSIPCYQKKAALFFFRIATRMREGGKSPRKTMLLAGQPAIDLHSKLLATGPFVPEKSMEKTVASVKSATFQQRKLHRCRQPCQKLAKTISCWSLPSPILFLPWETFVLPHLHIPQLLHMSKAPSTTAMPAKIHVT